MLLWLVLMWCCASRSCSEVTQIRVGRQASQEFLPAEKRVINKGSLLGSFAEVTAEGTYQLAEPVSFAVFL